MTNNRNKIVICKRMLMLAPLALAGLWLAGCRTAVYHRGDLAADSAQTAATQVDTINQALASTLTTLTNLVNQPAPDLRPQFDAFSASLDTLIAAAKRGDRTADYLAHSNDVFFAAWDKQLTTITNVDIRQRSAARRNEVSAQFRTANDRYADAREQLWSMVNYLRDVRRALRTDLTAKGVESVKPLVDNAISDWDSVHAALSQANNTLAALSAQMSSSRAPTTQ